ncbi:MAG: hypothetical protein H6747_16455 [Deltaproteobacteria bacterium]|nr:hypothetical protein [Deltaproteobacteria bacterium]
MPRSAAVGKPLAPELHAELGRLARILYGQSATVAAFRSARESVIRVEVPHRLMRVLVRRRMRLEDAANAARQTLQAEIRQSGQDVFRNVAQD